MAVGWEPSNLMVLCHLPGLLQGLGSLCFVFFLLEIICTRQLPVDFDVFVSIGQNFSGVIVRPLPSSQSSHHQSLFHSIKVWTNSVREHWDQVKAFIIRGGSRGTCITRRSKAITDKGFPFGASFVSGRLMSRMPSPLDFIPSDYFNTWSLSLFYNKANLFYC